VPQPEVVRKRKAKSAVPVTPAPAPAAKAGRKPRSIQPSENLPAGGKVDLKSKADVLAFLHTGGWINADVQQATYIVHYDDGAKVEIPVIGGKNIIDWVSQPGRADEVKYDPALGFIMPATSVASPQFVHVMASMLLLKNLRPNKESSPWKSRAPTKHSQACWACREARRNDSRCRQTKYLVSASGLNDYGALLGQSPNDQEPQKMQRYGLVCLAAFVTLLASLHLYSQDANAPKPKSEFADARAKLLGAIPPTQSGMSEATPNAQGEYARQDRRRREREPRSVPEAQLCSRLARCVAVLR